MAPWIAKTTERTTIQLVRPQHNGETRDPVEAVAFQPSFTYPIFGEQEVVFGYKGLSIQLSYSSGSLRLYPRIDYKQKYQSATNSSAPGATAEHIRADDVFGILKEYLPPDLISNGDEFQRAVLEDAKSFRPIGEKIHEYSRENEDGSSFKSSKFREYHRRMQLFVLLFIEGSSYIEDDDEKWEIYTIFQREHMGDSDTYHFVGYATTYPFFFWPDQFVVLPPFQKQGHGSELYQTLYEIFMSRKDVKEITVEDPNEDFSDMRDKNDMRTLITNHAFDGLTAPVSKSTFKELRDKFKLTDRQIQRCVEMHLLSRLNKLKKDEYKAFRLQVKQRLYLFNLDALRELEADDRKEKLHQTYEGVVEDYHRILEML
ncbi:acyl-CoA N-acyltransferase [Dichotomocladium elegans]|nr:acyl-CoA N-acyltransferase [Dichotomocladium elegans]